MQHRFLFDNLRSLARNLRSEPIPAVSSRLTAMAGRKLVRLAEELAYRTPFVNSIGRSYFGRGIAVMFHEIHGDVDAELRTGCDAAQLERIVGALRAAGREIVTPDEVTRRLTDQDAKPFALLTFDDAYRDNLTTALPVLERLEAPMTVFVPTGMITRDLYAWWLGLRELMRRRDFLDAEPMSRRFVCADLASKILTLREITSWIGEDQARANSFSALFKSHGIEMRSLVDRYAMDERELRRMAAHPLVTIGAHTETHRFLSGLSDAEVVNEFRSNKAWLEATLDQSISYLAYPYGTPGACGEREARLAKQAEFSASFTTRSGQLFSNHLGYMHLLPRIDLGFSPQSPSSLGSRVSGLHQAIATRFGNPVAIKMF